MELRHGGRIELVFDRATSDRIRYAATFETATGRWTGSAEIQSEHGQVELHVDPTPAWLVDLTTAILRAEWRARRSSDARPWPRRITRWRPEPGS